MTGFNPHPDNPHPCTECRHYRGPASTCGSAALCAHKAAPDTWRVHAAAERGCAFWTQDDRREVRLLVCGGRDYADRDALFRALDLLLEKRRVVVVIHGAARGADILADAWAKARGIERMPFEVTRDDWRRIGPSAGPKRNAQMIRDGRPDGVVAFPGGKGTADMTMQAIGAGLPVWHPYPTR